jgi:hypothetical protein
MSFDQLLHHCFKSLDSQISIWRIWVNENMNVIYTHVNRLHPDTRQYDEFSIPG